MPKSTSTKSLWLSLIGKKIIAYRGYTKPNAFGPLSKDEVELKAVLFDDEETILFLDNQDPYEYHDCCGSAKILTIVKSKPAWKELYDMKGACREANSFSFYSF